jgi:hypothetical protein
MSRPVVRKIVGMSLAPLLLAVVGDLEIFRIYFELFSVIVGTPPALTLRSAADGLLWTIGRTKKITLAVETAAVLAHDDSSEISQDESLRNNQMASNVQILEAYLEFLLRPCQRALVDHWPRPTPAITAPFFAGADTAPSILSCATVGEVWAIADWQNGKTDKKAQAEKTRMAFRECRTTIKAPD